MNTTSFSKTLKMITSFLLVFSLVLPVFSTAQAATTKATTYRLSTDSYLYDRTTSSRKRMLTIKTGTVVSSTYTSASGYFRRVTYAGKTGYVASKYLTLYDKKQKVSGQRYLTSQKTPIKNATRTTTATIGTLDEGDAYYTSQRVTDPYGDTWYRVKYDGKTGYVQAGAKPIAYQKISTTLTTTETYILRQYAGTGFPKVRTIPTDAKVQVIGRIGQWYSVKYAGQSGYMHQGAFAGASKQSVTTIPDTRFQTKAVTPLYDRTDGLKKSLTTVPKGSIITAKATSGTFHQVTYAGKTGYVASTYLTLYEKKQSISGQRYLISQKTPLKNAARTTATTIGTLDEGDVYYTSQRVTDPYGDIWYRVKYDGKTGYAQAGAAPIAYQKVSTTLATTDAYILRQYAGTGFPKVRTIPADVKVQVIGRIGQWYSVKYAGQSGYMHQGAFEESSKPNVTTKLPSTRFLSTGTVTVKVAPTDSSTTLATLSTGNVYYTKTKVTTPDGAIWYQVKKEGKTGYIKDGRGTPISYESQSNLSMKTTSATSIRSYAGPSYATIQTIPANTTIRISGKIGSWYRVSYGGKTGYAASNTFTTLATKQTITGSRFELNQTVSIKASPDAKASTLATLQAGDMYYTTQLVTSGSEQWHRVSKDGKTGYIPTGKGNSISYQSDRITMQTTGSTSLRSYAGNSYATIKTIPAGTSITVTGMIDTWYRVTFDGKTGYLAGQNVQELVKKESTSARYLVSSTTEVKASHQSDADTITRLTSGDVYFTSQLVTNGRNEQWHRLSVNGKTGYIRINNGSPISYQSVPSHQYRTTGTSAIRSYAGPSYDTVQTVPSGTVLSVTGAIGSWMKVTHDGKSGYVSNATLTQHTDTKKISGSRFLANELLNIKSSPDENASTVATLNIGNVYYTTSLITSYTNSKWHKVTVDGTTGYVNTDQNTTPIQYESQEKLYVRATSDAALRSYVGSSYNVVKTIPKNLVLTVTGKIGDWYKISYDGKSGYAYKGAFVTTSSKLNVYNSVATPYTFDSFISAQMKLNPPPQTDIYKNKLMYVSTGYVRLGGGADPVNGTLATVTATTPLNIRAGASTATHIYGQFQPGRMIKVYQSVSGFYTTYPRVYTSATNYSTIQWLNALETDVREAADPLKIDQNSSAFYQFLDLSKTTGASAATLDKMLANVTKGLGIFNKCSNGSCGQAFIDAGQKYSVNEAYLISHALLETGNGTSTLANGVTWNGRKVYNMYGIGAYDYDAINTGAAYAYSQGWFTPEAAIVGGAEFISTKYIHNEYEQNTLYKMRWSPMRPGTHQYATDMGWAVKQTSRIYSLYQQMDSYTATFDIPVFAR